MIAASDVCGICGEWVDRTLPGLHPFGPVVDHRIPVAAGGTDDLANLQLAHRSCNREKGATVRVRGSLSWD